MSNIASTGSAIEKHEVTCDLASKRKRAERDVLPFFRFKHSERSEESPFAFEVDSEMFRSAHDMTYCEILIKGDSKNQEFEN